MGNHDATRHSLLERLRDPQDREAWAEFVGIYSPFVYAVIRRRGVQPADAGDVMQEVMKSVFCRIDRFQIRARRGSFRKWLRAVARSRACDFLKSRGRQVSGTGDTRTIEQLAEHPAPDDTDAKDELEYQRSLFLWAVARIQGDFRGTTWQAFWLTYVDGMPCQDVANQLAMSLEAVHVARGRVLARLRQTIREVED